MTQTRCNCSMPIYMLDILQFYIHVFKLASARATHLYLSYSPVQSTENCLYLYKLNLIPLIFTTGHSSFIQVCFFPFFFPTRPDSFISFISIVRQKCLHSANLASLKVYFISISQIRLAGRTEYRAKTSANLQLLRIDEELCSRVFSCSYVL